MGMAAIPPQVTTLDEFFALPEDSYRHQLAVLELFRRLQPALASRPELLRPTRPVRDPQTGIFQRPLAGLTRGSGSPPGQAILRQGPSPSLRWGSG
jgi:hypothetical protein